MEKYDPGIYLGVDEQDYHKLDYISNSFLSRFHKCPAAALIPMEETPALLFGRAVHSYVLEGDAVFSERFVVAPACDRRTKVGKETWANFLEEAGDKTPITQEDFIKIYRINKSVREHPFAKELLADGISETTAIWDHKGTGLRCKARADWIPDGHNILVDLKTCQDASDHGFLKSVSNFRYFQQASFYLQSFNIASGTKHDTFIFIAVEKEPPFKVATFVLDEKFLEWGDAEVARLIKDVEIAKKTGVYPSYSDAGCVDLFLPGYINR